MYSAIKVIIVEKLEITPDSFGYFFLRVQMIAGMTPLFDWYD
jgi:hypothetical protein